jgi:hypothetical protein
MSVNEPKSPRSSELAALLTQECDVAAWLAATCAAGVLNE